MRCRALCGRYVELRLLEGAVRLGGRASTWARKYYSAGGSGTEKLPEERTGQVERYDGRIMRHGSDSSCKEFARAGWVTTV